MILWESFDPESREFLALVFRTAANLTLRDIYPEPCGTIDEANEFRERCSDIASTIEALS